MQAVRGISFAVEKGEFFGLLGPLGARYLERLGLPVAWHDARDLLTSVSKSGGQRSQDYLAAKCEAVADPDMQARLSDGGKVVLTQGFIARNEWGETVLLQQAAVGLLKGVVGRRRPFVYNDDPRIPAALKQSSTAVRSFPSGHTATAFAGAVFLSEVFARLRPDDPARHWVRGGSLALAAAKRRLAG